MELGAWRGAALAAIHDWRRYAPAAGSVAAHAVVFLGLGAMMAVSPPRARAPAPPVLKVELVTAEVALPRPAPKAAAPVAPAPRPPRRKAERPPAQGPAAPPPPGEPTATVENDTGAVPLASGPPAVPAGLKSLLEINPCADRLEKLRGECNRQWAKLSEEAQRGYSPALDQLAALYPTYHPDDPSIPAWAPVAMALLQSFVQMSVASAIGPAPAMQGGPGGGTGIESIGSRLAKPVPDPAFDTDMPQWLGFDHPARLPQPRDTN